ncbi:hypothetical protein ACIQPP_05310 [Streptomyces violaceusniger]|uniref:hypothetical protein n=1 Tax=Streptomyces violaceusniger TaxID=68280 RepID=UPI00131A6890|nr:hypothetical protein [Streptomyces hygroscopicus]
MTITVVGAALVTHAILVDHVGTWRAGLATLIVGVGGLVDARNRCYTEALIAHQAEVAKLTVRERWRYAEMGWKAARLDALEGEAGTPEEGDAQILKLPRARSASEARKNGSAS